MGGGAANTDVPIFPIFPNPAPPRHRTFSRYRPSTARNATVISIRAAAAAAVADGGMAVGRDRVGPLGARTSPATTTALRRRLTRPSRWMPRGTASCAGSTAGSRPGSSSLRPWSTSGTTRRSISTSPRSGRRCRWTCDGCLATLSAVHSHARGREERELEANVVAHLLEERKRGRSPGEAPIGALAQGHLPMRKGSGGRRDELVQSLYSTAGRRAKNSRARDPRLTLICPESRGWTTVRHDSSWYWRHRRQCRATLSAFARTRYYELSI